MDNNNNNNNEKDEKIWRFGRVSETNFGFTALLYDSCYCMLCSRLATMKRTTKEVLAHRQDKFHNEIVRGITIFQAKKRIDDVSVMDGVVKCDDLQRLGYVPELIKELFVKYYMDEKTKQSIYIEARRLCDSYVKNEPLVLLELALWKNACLIRNPTQDITARGGMVHYLLCGGWKENKLASRHDQLIEIAITNVLPFLG